MTVRGEAAIERAIRDVPFAYENAAQYDTHVQTPGPRQATTADQNLVLNIMSSLRRYDVNTRKIAADLAQAEPHVQKNLAEILTYLLGVWSELADCTQDTHPLANEYANAKKMVAGLFL